MVKIDLHKAAFITILRDIYTSPTLRTVLGFKGGTAAMLFYELPRFSIDLDFDLLDLEKKDIVFKEMQTILQKHGMLSDISEKRSTLFFLLNYQRDERNLKIEISKRGTKAEYIVKNYLGISMLVMKEEDMAAAKLSALLTRSRFASRDVFDLWFFLTNKWQLNKTIVEEKTGLTLSQAFKKAQERVQNIKKTELLAGLGELIDNKQKVWIKEKLIEETIFQLHLYQKIQKGEE